MNGPLFTLGLTAFFAAGLASWFARRAAWSIGAVDKPTGGRKIHKLPVPLLGGIGIGAVILIWVAVAWLFGFADVRSFPLLQMAGFAAAVLLILLVGLLDDLIALPAQSRFALYALACLLVIATGTVITKVSRIGGGAIALPFWFGAPFTFVWLLGVTFAVKVMDGLDGLVTGQTAIGAGLIAGLALTGAFFQPPVAAFAIIIGASFLGFLPSNIFPARQYLGEAGSVLAGFCLAFLAVVSGAKVATAFMALGLPLVDMTLVMAGRIARGVSPLAGDDTHLHFKLLKAGMSQRSVVALYWGIMLLFGLAAFAFQTRGKIVLVAALVLTVLLLSALASLRLKRQHV